jgi:hypothetical protein
MCQQLVLRVFGHAAVLRNEVVMQINFPLHLGPLCT